jgi:DNA-binding NtrC family response regulator
MQENATSINEQGTETARRLLVVDDQRGITKVIRTIATSLGFEVREINDPQAATEAFSEFRPHVLVLDLIMPEKDGLDVLNEVLVIDPKIEVVLTSGYGDTFLRLGDSVSKFHRDAGVRILRKPFRADALHELLKELKGR